METLSVCKRVFVAIIFLPRYNEVSLDLQVALRRLVRQQRLFHSFPSGDAFLRLHLGVLETDRPQLLHVRPVSTGVLERIEDLAYRNNNIKSDRGNWRRRK